MERAIASCELDSFLHGESANFGSETSASSCAPDERNTWQTRGQVIRRQVTASFRAPPRASLLELRGNWLQSRAAHFRAGNAGRIPRRRRIPRARRTASSSRGCTFAVARSTSDADLAATFPRARYAAAPARDDTLRI